MLKIIIFETSRSTVFSTIFFSLALQFKDTANAYGFLQRYTYRVLQTIQMKLILSCVWAERAILGRAKTALKFKYEI